MYIPEWIAGSVTGCPATGLSSLLWAGWGVLYCMIVMDKGLKWISDANKIGRLRKGSMSFNTNAGSQ